MTGILLIILALLLCFGSMLWLLWDYRNLLLRQKVIDMVCRHVPEAVVAGTFVRPKLLGPHRVDLTRCYLEPDADFHLRIRYASFAIEFRTLDELRTKLLLLA